MNIKNAYAGIVNNVLELAEVPGDVQLKIMEQATELLVEGFAKIHILSQITERDRQILELLGDGHRPNEIGAQVCLSARSVESELSRIRGIFKCKNSFQLIKMATDYNII